MVISDHIKLNGASPLRGQNVEDFGERFFDTTRMYTPELRALALRCAEGSGLRVHEGVYFFMPGRSLKHQPRSALFAFSAAMPSACRPSPRRSPPRTAGLPILGLSVITNMAAGVTGAALSGAEVNETGAAIGAKFSATSNPILKEL